jgi:RNA polymerase primary sigma factor
MLSTFAKKLSRLFQSPTSVSRRESIPATVPSADQRSDEWTAAEPMPRSDTVLDERCPQEPSADSSHVEEPSRTKLGEDNDPFLLTRRTDAADEVDQATVQNLEEALMEKRPGSRVSEGCSRLMGSMARQETFEQNSIESRTERAPDQDRVPGPLPEVASAPEIKIKDLVAESECSVRLRNAIGGAKALPVETVADYMRDPEQARVYFQKHVQNLGRKSVSELHELVVEAFASGGIGFTNSVPSDSSAEELDDSAERQRAHEAAQRLFQGLLFPDEILDRYPSVRLKNLLLNSYSEDPIPFSEFLSAFGDTLHHLGNQKNCGRKSLQELARITDDIVAERVKALGISEESIPIVRQVLEQRLLRKEELAAVLALEAIDLSALSKSDPAADWGASVSQITPRVLAELTAREQEVIKRRYALDGGEPETLEHISGDHGVTRERIRQIEAKALRKMRNKKVMKALSAALEAEDTIDLVFSNRKIITDEQIGSAAKSLTPGQRLAIDISYGGVKQFLESESVQTQAGWILERYMLELPEEPEIIAGSVRQRLVDAVLKQSLPIRISRVAEHFPDLTLDGIRAELADSFEASIEDDLITSAPRLPASARYILLLRKAGHALHCKEIRALNHEIFGKDDSIQQIGSVLGGLEEALIVARGTYNLYENLSLSKEDIDTIRNTVHDALTVRGEFVSVKILFSELFQGTTEQYGTEFDYYMLLGILQDDERFDVRRGLMVGLTSFSSGQSFLGLNEEIIAVLSEAGRALSLEEIAEALEGRRDTFLTSIATSLDNSPFAVSVGRGHYDLTSRVFGDEQRQQRLHTSCCLALSSGPRSALALAELIAPIFGEYHTRPLKGFLSGYKNFEIKGDVVHLREEPQEVSVYLEVRDVALDEGIGTDGGLGKLRDFLAAHGASDFTDLDPYLKRPIAADNEESSEDEILGKLLSDFGV